MFGHISTGVTILLGAISLLAQMTQAIKNPYTLSDLASVASIFMKNPLSLNGLTCEDAIS